MRKGVTGIIALIFAVLLMGSAVYAQQKMATKDEAKANLTKAVAYYREVGKEKAFAEFNKHDGKFTNLKKGLFINVYDLAGTCIATGYLSSLIGKNFIEIKDADGKSFMKEGFALANSKAGKGWIYYRWTNPATKKVEKKATCLERIDDYIISCGAYIQD
ncbi:MAG: cache domain-containing protein [Syntrophales bacterium]|nr:cache domain-containing protein [Syntrophales bacterium]